MATGGVSGVTTRDTRNSTRVDKGRKKAQGPSRDKQKRDAYRSAAGRGGGGGGGGKDGERCRGLERKVSNLGQMICMICMIYLFPLQFMI